LILLLYLHREELLKDYTWESRVCGDLWIQTKLSVELVKFSLNQLVVLGHT
jgi:hypothetical protein